MNFKNLFEFCSKASKCSLNEKYFKFTKLKLNILGNLFKMDLKCKFIKVKFYLVVTLKKLLNMVKNLLTERICFKNYLIIILF